MTRRAANVARSGANLGVALKGKVPDHWTWHDGKARVTGWHYPGRKAPEPASEPLTGRGVMATMKREKPVQERLL